MLFRDIESDEFYPGIRRNEPRRNWHGCDKIRRPQPHAVTCNLRECGCVSGQGHLARLIAVCVKRRHAAVGRPPCGPRRRRMRMRVRLIIKVDDRLGRAERAAAAERETANFE